MFINPLINVINYDYWMHKLEILRVIHKIENHEEILTQNQLNEFFEESEFSIGDKYADILTTMWVTFLYAPVIPIVLIFSLVNLILTYYVEKLTLIKRSSIKNNISHKVSQEMIE
jgi:hypothetical protein